MYLNYFIVYMHGARIFQLIVILNQVSKVEK